MATMAPQPLSPRAIANCRLLIVTKPKAIVDEKQEETDVERDSRVTLREVDDNNVRAILELDVAPHQKAYVAPNAVSLAQYAVATKAWTRAIYAGEIPVGYVLLSDDDDEPRYYLWRFMVDCRYQGKGFGRDAMALIHDYVRSRPGGTRLYLSYVPLRGGPEPFYKSLGYVDTGVEHEGELEAVLDLDVGTLGDRVQRQSLAGGILECVNHPEETAARAALARRRTEEVYDSRVVFQQILELV